jgi:hypothetical protein
VKEFLKHYAPKSQSFEDTYQHLLAALEEENLRDCFEGNKGIVLKDDVAIVKESTDLKEQIYQSRDNNIIQRHDDEFSVKGEVNDNATESKEEIPIVLQGEVGLFLLSQRK